LCFGQKTPHVRQRIVESLLVRRLTFFFIGLRLGVERGNRRFQIPLIVSDGCSMHHCGCEEKKNEKEEDAARVFRIKE